MTGDWSDPPVICALLLLPETTFGCGPSAAPLIVAVKVITSVAPLKPPAGTTNGPHCGVAEPAEGCRREPAWLCLPVDQQHRDQRKECGFAPAALRRLGDSAVGTGRRPRGRPPRRNAGRHLHGHDQLARTG